MAHRPNLRSTRVRYDVETRPPRACETRDPAAEAALNVQEGIPGDSDNIQPRVAIAWDPWNDGKTVVRAA